MSYWASLFSVSNTGQKLKHLTDANCKPSFIVFLFICASHRWIKSSEWRWGCIFLFRLQQNGCLFVFWKKSSVDTTFQIVITTTAKRTRTLVPTAEATVERFASSLPPRGGFSFTTRLSHHGVGAVEETQHQQGEPPPLVHLEPNHSLRLGVRQLRNIRVGNGDRAIVPHPVRAATGEAMSRCGKLTSC